MNNIKNILLMVFYLLLFGFIFFLFRDICIFDVDDLKSTIEPYPLWREENGRFVFNILSRIFCLHIPNILGIHVQNALSSIGVCMYAIIQLFLFTVVGCFYLLKNKNIFIFLLPFLFVTGIFYCNYMEEHFFYYTIVSFQYGYMFATATVLSFLLLLYNYVLNGKLPDRKYLWLTCLLGFCAGNSTQFMCYTVIITIFLLFMTYFIKRKFNVKKIKNLIKLKRVFLPVLSFFSGFVLMVACPGFWNEVAWRHAKSFEEIKDIFVPFLKGVFNVVILRYQRFLYLVLFLILAIIIIGIIKKQFKNNLLKCIIICFPIVGAFGYFLTLILAGSTFPSEELKFWFYEPFYHFCYLMILSTVVSMLFGFLISETKNRIFKFCFCIIFILFSSQIINHVSFEKYIGIKEEIKNNRINEYINEKMILYYYHNGIEEMKITKVSLPYQDYFYKIYNIKLLNNPVIVEKEEAIAHYNSLGGTFSSKELKRTDFQKLYDKDFVLNTKGQ